jgi:hypothetical protein
LRFVSLRKSARLRRANALRFTARAFARARAFHVRADTGDFLHGSRWHDSGPPAPAAARRWTCAHAPVELRGDDPFALGDFTQCVAAFAAIEGWGI